MTHESRFSRVISCARQEFAGLADKYADRLAIALVTAVIAGAIFRALLIPGHFSLWAYGDAQMYNAGVHFANEGYVAHYFLPEINPGNPHGLIPNNGPNGRYSHYPALHAIANGLLISAAYQLNVQDDVLIKQGIQVFYILCVAAGIAAYFAALNRLYGRSIAAIFSIFLALSPLVAGYSDSLCDQPFNIFLLGIFFYVYVAHWDRADQNRRDFSPLIALVAFLVSRNSIEPIVVVLGFGLLYGYCMNLANGRSLYSAARHYLTSIALPISVGLAIHFYQSYLDFGNFKDFYDHWMNLHDAKFDFSNVSISRSSLFAKYLVGIQGVATFSALVLFLAVCLISLLIASRRSVDSINRAVVFRKIGFAFSFAAGFVAFPLLFPQQATAMIGYSAYFVYLPTFLIGVVLLMDRGAFPPPLFLRSQGESRALWIVDKLRPLGSTIWIIYFAVTVSAKGVSVLLLPQDVTNLEKRHAWGFSLARPEPLAIAARSDVRQAVREATRPTDILVFPASESGASAREVDPLIEFYLQRHGITARNDADLKLVCQVLESDRARLAGSFKKYVKPNLYLLPALSAGMNGEKITAQLRKYDCD